MFSLLRIASASYYYILNVNLHLQINLMLNKLTSTFLCESFFFFFFENRSESIYKDAIKISEIP